MGAATLAVGIIGGVGGTGAGVYDFSEGSGSVVIPTGATGVTIEVWGAGGGGGYGVMNYNPIVGEFIELFGGGGGGGAYAKSVLVLSGDDGKTIQYEVGVGGNGGTSGDPTGGAGTASTAFAGSYALTAMTSTGGGGGSSGAEGAEQGVGGIATGGDTTNTNGNGGAIYTYTGGAAISGDGGLVAGAGGDGGFALLPDRPTNGDAGANGRVRMVFTF